MTRSGPLLAMDGVEVRYSAPARGPYGRRSEFRALRDIRLAIHRSDALGLVGESGCGKSTLGRTALLLERPHRGTVLFDGVDLTALKPGALRKIRSRMQMIFQDPLNSLNPRMTVGQLVGEPYQIHHPKPPKKAVEETVVSLLSQVGLDPAVTRRYPHEFSGGQRQRIAIARALSCGPEFIVADEPTSALDVSVQAQTLNLLMDLQDENNLTFLFISHNLKVVQLFCNRIAVMYLGEIVETGPTDLVCSNPAHPYTEALMNAVPSLGLQAQPEPLAGDVGSPVDLPDGCAFHPRCPQAGKVSDCFTVSPALEPAGAGRQAACHLAKHRL